MINPPFLSSSRLRGCLGVNVNFEPLGIVRMPPVPDLLLLSIRVAVSAGGAGVSCQGRELGAFKNLEIKPLHHALALEQAARAAVNALSCSSEAV